MSEPPPIWGYYKVDIFDCPPFEMFSNNDDPRALDIVNYKRFEPHSMKIWCSLARNATAILDIGAHVGVYALAAASLRKDIIIYAFEPNPHAYARLRINKDRNQFRNICDEQLAIGQEKSVVDFAWTRRDVPYISSGGSVGLFPDRDCERTITRDGEA